MATTQQTVVQTTQLAGAGASAIVASVLGPAAAAGPIGIAIGGAVLAITQLSGTISHLIDGCGQSCVQATDIVNQAETYVQQIAAAYWQAPTRTKSFQAWTLQQLDAIFAKVAQLCGQIGGTAGANCVKERLTRGYRPPWCTDLNVPLSQCGGWYDVTYDPIANDAGVQPDPSGLGISGTQIAAAVPGGFGTIFLAGAGLLALIAYKVRSN